jgi:predicted dehydrogenase
VEINNPMLDEFRDFVKSLESDDEDTPVPQEHGLNVLKILEATEKSSELGQEIILK